MSSKITTNVDQKLLRTTKFPAEFSQKVDTQKINIPVIKNWASGEVSKILGYEDEIVTGLLFDLLEGQRFPDIKSLQIQLTGFLEKEAATFCKELWTLCLSAQQSSTGIPPQLLEAKKLELMQEKMDQEKAAEEARRRRDEERNRERELDSIRQRERGDRGRGRDGRGDRGGYRRNYSRSPPRFSRRSDDYRRPPPRDIDTYVPATSSRRQGDKRRRSRSRDGSASPPPRSRRRSPSPRPRESYRDDRRSRRRSPSPRRARRRNTSSPEASPPPKRDRSRSRTRSPRRRPRRRDSSSPPPRRRSRSTEDLKDDRTNSRKDRRPTRASRSRTPRSPSRTRESPRSDRKRHGSLPRYDMKSKHQQEARNSSPAAEADTTRPRPEEKDSNAGASDEVGLAA
ncbi:hypothetical protein M8818_004193 [Zalaria obscura]|uniref:Uncharacterized protein n=1 Tax=Zalaria obscura TaxID=2024903 RepID=A0ACC3SEH5_9PEZI